ncbi:MAG: deoxyguanosinetriphosphate triphosphohydrolase [Elusimicrobiota bacterium]
MRIRERFEEWEKNNLSPYATLSTSTAGRAESEDPCPVRTEFQIDRDRILHSLGFRLLKHKTQVFLSTSGEQFRTRLTHTLEVASIARYIAQGLDLNRDLVEAIALGHDLGHTPFGHIGEVVLNELTSFRFKHSEQGVRVVTLIENSGKGLNLTREVIDGISEHSKGTISMAVLHDSDGGAKLNRASSIEGEVVQFSDWFAYINHDIDDAFNMGIIKPDDLPGKASRVLGYNFRWRLVTMLQDVIEASRKKNHIYMSSEVLEATDELRQFLYDRVYCMVEIAKKQDYAKELLTYLFEYFKDNYDLVTREMPFLDNEDPERGACDYVAFLTDKKAQESYSAVKN